MIDLQKSEELLLSVTKWVWRNILASGVVLVCFFFLYSKLDKLDNDLKQLRSEYNTTEYVTRLFMQRARGDFGYPSFAVSAPDPLEEIDPEKLEEKYESVTETINGFIDEQISRNKRH